jgi:hypothetical protein
MWPVVFLRGLPASGGSERLFPARDERGMKRSRRSLRRAGQQENADLQELYGSDGTRTRDLRRDRLVRGSRRLTTIGVQTLYSCGFPDFRHPLPHG